MMKLTTQAVMPRGRKRRAVDRAEKPKPEKGQRKSTILIGYPMLTLKLKSQQVVCTLLYGIR